MMGDNNFSLTILDSGVARLAFDVPGRSVNVLNEKVMTELDALLSEIKNNPKIKSLVITSAKKNVFIAGADISEIKNLTDAKDATEKSRAGQLIFYRLESLPFPTIAAIDGACLGGGMELALSCTYRVASDNAKTQLGLPEVTLGILPGFGGTQRLPRLIGLLPAIDLILSGKSVDGKKAYKLGLVDDYFSADRFNDQAVAFAEKLSGAAAKAKIANRRKLKLFAKFTQLPVIKDLILIKVRNTTVSKTKGHYPAPLRCLELIKETFAAGSRDEGYKKEALAFGKLAVTDICKNLIRLYYINEELKKDSGAAEGTPVREIKAAGVIGGGIMGSGIAWLLSYKDIPVRLKEVSLAALQKGVENIGKIYGQLIKIKKIKRNQVQKKMHKVSLTEDYSGFKHIDIVIEAVIEDKELKTMVYKDLEQALDPGAIIASNTSSISISELQDSLANPSRFIGIHFFNPVNRMPLVEIIPGQKTSPEVIATSVALAKKLGKTPVVVQSCAGFLVNRILMPYLNEAALLLQEGARIDKVDKILLDFGMPMGPFTLVDEIGLDVAYKVAHILESAYGERMKAADILRALSKEKDLLGKKTKKGFYLHRGKKTAVNHAIYDFVRSAQQNLAATPVTYPSDVILDRCLLMMINEAALCIEENVVAKASYLDMAMIMGIGFPPFRGGLLRYADQRGIDTILQSLNRFSEKYGNRFRPCALLTRMSAEKRKFCGE